MFNRVANTIASRFGTLETTQEKAKYLPDHLYVNYLQAENMLRTWRRSKTKELTSIYESILQEVPGFSNAWARLADIEYRNGTNPVENFEEPESAKRWLERSRHSADQALQLDPDNKRALTVTAQLAITDNLWLEADGLYRRALDKHPGDAEVLAAYAQNNRNTSRH